MSEHINNRRQHKRVYRNFILTYHLKGNEKTFDVSQINNISQGGISFIATDNFAAGQEIDISLRTPFLAEALALEGVVLESKEKISGMIYEVRIKFTQVSAASKDVLKKIEVFGE